MVTYITPEGDEGRTSRCVQLPNGNVLLVVHYAELKKLVGGSEGAELAARVLAEKVALLRSCVPDSFPDDDDLVRL